MEKDLLKAKAIRFERLLSNYSKSKDEVCELFRMPSMLMEASKLMNVATPLEWRDIPGGIFFTEGNLTKFPDLEQAFAEFRIELTGGEPSAISRLRAKQH